MTIVVPADAVVVLDVDDTLYLERDYVRSGFEAVGELLAADRGVEGVGDTLWTGFEAGVRGDAFDQALTAHGLSCEAGLITGLVECYRNHNPRIGLEPDAHRLLERLPPRPLGVITDGPAASQRAKIGALGLDEIVEGIVVTAELGPGHSKPDPLPYRRIEKRFKTGPARCWYIADNPDKDFVTPLTRGWRSVRIRRPGSLHETTATPTGVPEVRSLDELIC